MSKNSRRLRSRRRPVGESSRCHPRIDKIHILGGPGSGKSYLAKRLSAFSAAPVCHLDSLFWNNRAKFYDTRTPAGLRDQRLRDFVEQPKWIVEGVYHQWVQECFRRADLIVVLRPPVILRDWRILRRFIRRRFGLAEPKRERVRDFLNLITWNHNYDSDNLRRAKDVLAPFEDKTLICRGADAAYSVIQAMG